MVKRKALLRIRAARAFCLIAAAGGIVAASDGSLVAAVAYPLTLEADASMETATAKVSSTLTIHVDRLMLEAPRKRVTDALRYGGYANFLNTLRTLPPIGWIELSNRKVEIRYAHEVPNETGGRLVLVADRPLFFVGGDPAKSRAGYELTMVELRFDGSDRATGTMTGAARVKPAGEGQIALDDFAAAPVQLNARIK
jgi:hypothetical protein